MAFTRLPGGGRLHHADRGERRDGVSPVLLLHGAGASSAIWMMALARLARGTYAVAVDLPGHGPSPAAAAADTPQATMTAYRDAAGGAAAALCLGPSVLVGHSMGALVAVEAALAWPDKVHGLVLCGAAPRLPVREELLALLRNDPAAVPAWIAVHGLSPQSKPALRRAFLAAGLVTPPAVTLADFEAVAATDLTERIRALTCPVIWLDGADDRIVTPAEGRAGEIRTVAAAGHLLPIEAPAAIAEAALELAGRPRARVH